MKTQINEIKRMQQLAGILNEEFQKKPWSGSPEFEKLADKYFLKFKKEETELGNEKEVNVNNWRDLDTEWFSHFKTIIKYMVEDGMDWSTATDKASEGYM